jgi:biopolymer transport protein ExbD
VKLSAAAPAGNAAGTRPVFLRLSPEAVSVNGETVEMGGLAAALAHDGHAVRPVLVALAGDVSAQRLADLLGALRSVPKVAPTVLGGQP